MSEQVIQAGANGMLGLMFLAMASEYVFLFLALDRRKRTTRLGHAMKAKYVACTVAFVALAILQGYSVAFNLSGSSGVFTFPIRNSLRGIAVAGMIVAWFWMRRMRSELIRAENEEGGADAN